MEVSMTSPKPLDILLVKWNKTGIDIRVAEGSEIFDDRSQKEKITAF